MNRINNEYDKFIKSIAGTNIVDVIPHSTDSADVATAIAAHVRAAEVKRVADEQAVAAAKRVADEEAAEKAAAEKAVADQAAADAAVKAAAAEKAVADQAAADAAVKAAAAEKAVADQAAAAAAAEKTATEAAAAVKAAADAAEKAATEAAEKAATEAAEKAATEAAEKTATEAAAKAVADQAAAAAEKTATEAVADADVKAAAEKAVDDERIASAEKQAVEKATATAAAIAADVSAADIKRIADIKLAANQVAAAIAASVAATHQIKESGLASTAANNMDAVIAAAASVATARAITQVSSPPESQVQPTNAAAIAEAASTIAEKVAEVAPPDSAESAVCTTKLVAACKEYYVTAQPDVAEITRDDKYEDEQQAQSLCGKHALNNLFRTTWTCSNVDDPYTAADLVMIKNENTSNSVENYNKYLKQLHTFRPIKLHKLCQLHNVFSGDNEECKEGDAYDMEVLVNALHIAGYNTTQITIDVNNPPTAVDTVLEILKTKPIGLILRTLSGGDSGHFIAVRKQLSDGNKYEAIDTLYEHSIHKTKNTSTHAITTTDELQNWLNGAKYNHISKILVVHDFDGKYIPYNPAESSPEDKNMIFTNGDGNVYAYKFGPPRKMIDITDIICNQCKQDAKSQFDINHLYTCIEGFSDEISIEGFSDEISIDSGVKINNFKGYIPIYENDLKTIIEDIQRQDAAIPASEEEQKPAEEEEEQKPAEEEQKPGEEEEQKPAKEDKLDTSQAQSTPVTDQRIANGLLLLISHISKHKNDAQTIGEASTVPTNIVAESAQNKIVKPSIKFDNIKYNDAVEKFKKNINREFADANSIEIRPVTIDIGADGQDKYILFGSFIAGGVKITRYNSHYDKQIEPKMQGSVNQQDRVVHAVQTTNSATNTPAPPPNNENYSAAIAAAVAAITAR